jgi:uncharacterized protein
VRETSQAASVPVRERAGGASSWVPYAAPFLTLVTLLALAGQLGLPTRWSYPVRTLAVAAALLVFSRRAIELRPRRWLASTGLGIAVCAVWIGPDLIWPGYRTHWLFQSALTGSGSLGAPAVPNLDPLFLFFRIGGSALVVPIAEELFWRAWLMRSLIAPDFARVPLGTYSAQAFWITAVLFASEHGSYWDVGLAAGVAYNWWMLRTRSLADCILAHAVTNACLAAYVLLANRWEYWL